VGAVRNVHINVVTEALLNAQGKTTALADCFDDANARWRRELEKWKRREMMIKTSVHC
jgi:hypothetical protein